MSRARICPWHRALRSATIHQRRGLLDGQPSRDRPELMAAARSHRRSPSGALSDRRIGRVVLSVRSVAMARRHYTGGQYDMMTKGHYAMRYRLLKHFWRI